MKPLPLAVTPAPPAKVQAEPVGTVDVRAVRTRRARRRPLESRVVGWPAVARRISMSSRRKAVLSPPAVSSAWNVIVCVPAATVNAAVA